MPDTLTSNAPGGRHDLVYQVVVLAAALALIAVAMALDLRDGQVKLPIGNVSLPEMCWYKRLSGFNCPGCGMTRCVVCLFHGEFLRGWHFNPGGYLFSVILVCQLPYRIAQIWRISRGLPAWRPMKSGSMLVSSLAVVLLVQWIIRGWWQSR
jgi:hypothetical protein